MKQEARMQDKIDWSHIACVFAVALMLFSLMAITPGIEMVVTAAAWIARFASCHPRRNAAEYVRIGICALAFEIGYVIAASLRSSFAQMWSCLWWLHVFYIVFVVSQCSVNWRKGNQSELVPTLPVLYPEHARDLERIKRYLAQYSAVGIEGKWGSGKTLLVRHLQKDPELQKVYTFIIVPLLSCNVDELPTLLIREIERVLRQGRVWSAHSSRLRNVLEGTDALKAVREIVFPGGQTYTEALQGFCDDIMRLEKGIIIVFEDVDRVKDPESVRKLFSIAESLTTGNDHIKTLYEYSQDGLEELDERFDRGYVEKYIPFTVQLSELSFRGALDEVLSEEAFTALRNWDFQFLFLPMDLPAVYSVLRGHVTTSVEFDYVSIRKVRQFLEEINALRNEIAETNKWERRVLIIYCLLKHFDAEFFRRMRQGEPLEHVFPIQNGMETQTVSALLAQCQDGVLSPEEVEKILTTAENARPIRYLSLLEYDVEPVGKRIGAEAVLNTSVDMLRRWQKKERTERLMWHLVAAGKSSYSDMRATIDKLDAMVLKAPATEQKERYNAFLDECYHQKFDYRDNTTAFRIGVPSERTLFEAMAACQASTEQWKRFLRFYFANSNHKQIDLLLVSNLLCCPLENREVYLLAIRVFNGCRIVGNIKQEEV